MKSLYCSSPTGDIEPPFDPSTLVSGRTFSHLPSSSIDIGYCAHPSPFKTVPFAQQSPTTPLYMYALLDLATAPHISAPLLLCVVHPSRGLYSTNGMTYTLYTTCAVCGVCNPSVWHYYSTPALISVELLYIFSWLEETSSRYFHLDDWAYKNVSQGLRVDYM